MALDTGRGDGRLHRGVVGRKLYEEYEVSADEARKDVEEITGEWNSVGVID